MLPNRIYLEEFTEPSKKYEWIPMDTLDLFKQNLKNNPNDNTLNYYLNNPIIYSLNNYGFRTYDDFNSKDYGNVFLGCSHTFGLGHHLENIWSYKLNEFVGGKFWNLSVGGSGIMTHFRIFYEMYRTLKIKNVFHYAPKNYYRYEFFINNEPFPLNIPHDTHDKKKIFGDFYNLSLANEKQKNIIYDTNILAINALCNEIGCNYYFLDEPSFPINKIPTLDARDLKHYDICKHDYIYNEFLREYKLKNKQTE
jgi:hypothetical protein